MVGDGPQVYVCSVALPWVGTRLRRTWWPVAGSGAVNVRVSSPLDGALRVAMSTVRSTVKCSNISVLRHVPHARIYNNPAQYYRIASLTGDSVANESYLTR